MDSSRRAVESYWRSKMIDGVTTDEDRVAPVYKLDEVCELLRSSHVSIVKEVSDFILKRLDHKSPIVKQKALRLIKYSVGKSGVEFKREMQRHSAVIRQLFHYKGQLDPLKGDALNKAVRDTAHEAISAIFDSEDNKPAPAEDINRRIQGFGNKNFDMQMEDKRSFLSEVVGLGSASIRQGLNAITSANSRKNENGSYRCPNLQRSLTRETDSPDNYVREESPHESWGASGVSKNVSAGPWIQDSTVSMPEMTGGETHPSLMGGKSSEERLLETIVTSGGVRLQPARDALQVFLVEASKLDPLALSHALESKLQSNLWQVRMKALCVLESILRKKDDGPFATVASYFNESRESLARCSESPQGSLRDKTSKVLGLLDGEHTSGSTISEKQFHDKAVTHAAQMPDLIDTGNPDDYGRQDSTQNQIDPNVPDLTTSEAPVVHELFGDSLIPDLSTSENKTEDDPFADVSFHAGGDGEHVSDLFSGLMVDDKHIGNELNTRVNNYGSELFDIFSSTSEQLLQVSAMDKDVNDLMTGLSLNAFSTQQNQQEGACSDASSVDPSSQPSHHALNKSLNDLLGSQSVAVNPSQLSPLFPTVPLQYNIPSNFIYNQAFASQPINYNAMSSLISQQQLLAAMTNFQNLGNFNTQDKSGFGQDTSNGMEGGFSSPLPDIFHATNKPVQSLSTTTNSSKKEETKAFDFISDHISASRHSKRVI